MLPRLPLRLIPRLQRGSACGIGGLSGRQSVLCGVVRARPRVGYPGTAGEALALAITITQRLLSEALRRLSLFPQVAL